MNPQSDIPTGGSTVTMSNRREYRIGLGCGDRWLHITVEAGSPDAAIRNARRLLGIPLELLEASPDQNAIVARVASRNGCYCTAYCPPDCPGPDYATATPLKADPANRDADLCTSQQLQFLRNKRDNASNAGRRRHLDDRISSVMVPVWGDLSVIDALIGRFAADPNTPERQVNGLQASADLLDYHARKVCQALPAQQAELLSFLADSVAPTALDALDNLDLPPAGQNMFAMYEAVAQSAAWAEALRRREQT